MLRIDALTKRYPSFTLGPLSLTVGAEVVGVLGPSGSGKTTLLSLVAGTEVPTGGTVRLNGQDLAGHSLETRGTARVFQESALFPHLTARENLAYAAAPPDRVEALATRLEIDGVLDQPARTLSGGEGRRVEVARALASDPDALLLDEPTAGLDAPVRRRLRGRLRALLTTLDIPVLYVTHNQEEAAMVADRIAVLNEGDVEQVGPPADVMQRPATPFVARFTGNPNVIPARVSGGRSSDVELRGGGSFATAGDPPASGRDVWLCVRPEEIDVRAEARTASGETRPATIADAVFDGHTHVLTLQLENSAVSLRAHVLPPTYRALTLDDRRQVHVHVPPTAIHLIPRSC